MSRLTKFWPPAASALLLSLAFPPFNLGLLVFVALVPWLMHLQDADGRRGWRSGYLLGLLFGLGQLLWLGTFVGTWTRSPAIGAFPWIGATVLFALYFGLAGWLITIAFRKGRPWMIPLIWAGIEVFRSYIPVFAFPWGLLATPLWPYTPLIQSAYFGSIYLVSAWAVLISTIIAMMMKGEPFTRLRPLVNSFLAVFALTLFRTAQEPATEKFVVTVGQPGVDMAFGDQQREPEALAASIDPMIQSAKANGSQLLVLPEGIANARHLPPLTSFTLDPELPTLFGAQRGSGPSFQSAFAFDGQFRYIDKTRLVIFGEFVPGRGIIPYPETFRLPAGDLAAGTGGVQSLELAGLRVGPIVCFEALFPDISYHQARNGSRLLAVMSIDDWYMGSTAPDQLRAASVWRAVETGLPLVRSATLGYTMAVDHKGHIVSEAPLRKPLGMRVEVQVPTSRQGFVGFPLFPGLAFASLFLIFIGRSRKEDQSGPT
jgi:apolipoprotein N-acyltransferase